MKTQLKLLTIFYLLSSICLSTFAQGSLTPPDAPAPTMKSLDQIEPRTPISSLPYTINTGGSYYLTGNLTTAVSNGIVIGASGVTLDLNGFTIYSSVTLAQNGGTAILLNNGITDVTIQNGHIFGGVVNTGFGYFGSGFGWGIQGGTGGNTTVRNVSISGCLYFGISLNSGDSTLVESCTVRTAGSYGILASTIKSCSASDCGSIAIYGNQASDCYGQIANSGNAAIIALTAQSCYGQCNGSGNGINAGSAQNCYGTSGSGYGINATSALNCYGFTGTGTGLYAAGSAVNCYGYSNNGSGSGLIATSAQNCYGQSNGSGYGIFASTAQNCYSSSGSGTGLSAFIANVCHGISSSGTAMSVTHNVNSF